MIQYIGFDPQSQQPGFDTLAAEVDSKLSRSIGPESYTRDDTLQARVLEHYRVSLERMVNLARSVGAKVIFVTPAANLKDSSPFKSEHTDNLSAAAGQRMEQQLSEANAVIRQKNWALALALLDDAVEVDPRNAELLYRRGKVLMELGRYQEARSAFIRARDEDVCPLRALTPMRGIVTEVARENGVPLIDYIGLLEERMQREFGQPVPGKEYFLDHVHPTIEGHKILALALLQTMVAEGLAHPGPDWGQQAINQVVAKITESLDQTAHGQALANLAKVLLWAGKGEDAAPLARQAMETAGNDLQVATNAAGTLVTYALRQGDLEGARKQLNAALEKVPSAGALHLKLGKTLGRRPYLKLDEAAAHLLWACWQMPGNDVAYELLGQTMFWRNRPRIAYPLLQESLRLNPNNPNAQTILAQIKPILGQPSSLPDPHELWVEKYPNGDPRKLVQLGPGDNGRPVADGLSVEFHKNGRVKHLVDFEQGVKTGNEMTWDERGEVLSRFAVQQDKPVNLTLAMRQFYEDLGKTPGSAKLHLKLGRTLMDPPFLELDEAVAHILFACQQQPDSTLAFQLFGQAMARRGRPDIAYASLRRAVELNPRNQVAQKDLDELARLFEDLPVTSDAAHFSMENYPSGAPQMLVQLTRLSNGRSVPDGIRVEYYENGRIKRLVDFVRGVQDGLDMSWSENGELLSCLVFLKGKRAYGKLQS